MKLTNLKLLYVVLGICYAGIFAATYQNLKNPDEGWQHWQISAWLINYADGPVRRGFVGSVILTISDFLVDDPVLITVAIQLSISVAILALVVHRAIQQGLPDRLLILLLSPAFLMFWFTNYSSFGNTEIISYLAFALLLNAYTAPASMPVFFIAVLGHEANVFLLPFYLAALCIAKSGYLPLVLASAAALIGMGIALIFPTADPSVICQALLDRNVEFQYCSGAIAYLENDLSYAISHRQVKLESYSRIQFMMVYLASLLPVVVARPKLSTVLGIVAGVLFIPLYYVAVDWGRWISMHIFSLTFIILLLGTTRPEMPRSGFVALLGFNMLWGISHVGGVFGPGFAQTILETLP